MALPAATCCLLGLMRLTNPIPISGVPQALPTDPCVANPNGPKCIGRWMDPIELCAPGGVSIGCNPRGDCGAPPCAAGMCSTGDEIAHAALIPSGPRAGEVLFWTRCDKPSQNPAFATYFWDPATQQVTGSTSFPAGAADAFCNGHTWTLDADGKAKLFNVGGSVTNLAYWFDAESATWNPGTDPVDLPAGDKNYYPSIVSYGDDANKRCVVATIGGTSTGSSTVCPPDLFTRWWSLASPFTTGSWTVHNTAYSWFQYPRTILLSQNVILTSGHVVTCEDSVSDPYTTADWGGNPVQVIDLTTGTHQDLANLDPNTVFSGGFPMGSHQPIRGWNYDNAVVLHTLKPGWTWTSDPNAVLSRYDLDRVLAFGGVPKLKPAAYAYNAHSSVLELQGAASQPPNLWTWREKARPATGRLTSNWVILPDGRILVMGGASKVSAAPANILGSSECFDPRGPNQNGTWQVVHSRLIPTGFTEVTPRGYHSTALLLPGGEVALMGGVYIDDPSFPRPDPIHTLEVYRPSYLYYTGRPSLTNVPATIHYPDGSNANTFCVQTNAAINVIRACLIGVGSVTHHFDYGQRYIELMTRQVSCTGGNVEVFPPLKASLAPPGYYLLFLIDWQDLPSVGRLVKVDYQRP